MVSKSQYDRVALAFGLFELSRGFFDPLFGSLEPLAGFLGRWHGRTVSSRFLEVGRPNLRQIQHRQTYRSWNIEIVAGQTM
jgi:hypothetical protein